MDIEKYKTAEVGNNCLIKARNYAKAENWTRAFPHYLMCFEIFPNDKSTYEQEFTEVLYQLGIWLELRAQFTEAAKWYTIGLQYFPLNTKILNNFGEYLLRIEESEMALTYLKTAFETDRRFLLAEKNLLTAKLNVIPRWHFRMMNDRQRNNAYRCAIHSAITPEHNKVLDIGAGCGLLSFYASECTDTQSVVAVESSTPLYTIATKALKDYNVKVINQYSTFLSSEDIGLSNVLVTEIFDAGLFGEHALKTLIHAWENLLEPSAKIVPCSADLFVTGISSKVISSRHRLCNVIPQLELKDMCVTQRTAEPYEAENLKQKKVIYLTNTLKALSVNFTDVEQLKRIYTEADSIPVITLKCVKGGIVHAFAIWFDLHLDRNITITTNPSKDSVTCWEQAVIYVDHPVTLQEGEEIKLQLSCVSNKLKIKILDHTPTCAHCFKVSPEIVTFLNDIQIVEAAIDLNLPNRYKKKESQILDLNPFPLFALSLATKGFPGSYKILLKDLHDWQFLNYIWCCNGIPPISEPDPDLMVNFEMYKAWELDNHLTDESFDVIFVNPISKNGTLCEETFKKLPKLNSALKCDGLIYPMFMRLQIEVIESKYLDFCNKVSDDNLFGFVVADEINEYAVLEHWQVEPQYYRRKTLCYFVGRCINFLNNYEIPTTNTNIRIPISGNANGVLYWYTLEFSKYVIVNTYKSFHYNGACFIFKRPQVTNGSDFLELYLRQEQGLLKIYCDDDENESI